MNKTRFNNTFIEAIYGAETTNRKTIITIVWILFENDDGVLYEGVLMNRLEDIIEKNKLSDINSEFAKNAIGGIVDKYIEIDKIIAEVSRRPLDSIGSIERNILRFGVFELKFGRAWAPAYVINEAIELTKNLVNESAGKFINGVLGGLVPDEPRQLPVKQIGGIIFNRNSETLKFALVKTAYKKWTVPKGKLSEGEDLKEGFKRAIKKKIGIEVEVIKEIHRDSFTARPPDGPIKKEAVYFLGTTNNWVLCLEKKPGVIKANWFTYEEVKKLDLDSPLEPMILESMDEAIKEYPVGRIERIRRWIRNWLRLK